jgi:hypothetical protein
MRAIDADRLIDDCQLAQKQADRHGREFANAFYSGGGEVSTEWWCVEDMIENAPTIEARKKGKWIDYTEDGYVECPFCHSATNCDDNKDELHFCFSCGADMREEGDS